MPQALTFLPPVPTGTSYYRDTAGSGYAWALLPDRSIVMIASPTYGKFFKFVPSDSKYAALLSFLSKKKPEPLPSVVASIIDTGENEEDAGYLIPGLTNVFDHEGNIVGANVAEKRALADLHGRTQRGHHQFGADPADVQARAAWSGLPFVLGSLVLLAGAGEFSRRRASGSFAHGSLRFISDPGHGWLEVPVSELVRLGIAKDISRYSYKKGAMAYLEEDSDMGKYLGALAEAGESRPALDEVYQERTPIRGYASYR